VVVPTPLFTLAPVVTQLQVESARFAALTNIHPLQERRKKEKAKKKRKIKSCFPSDQKAEPFRPTAPQSLDQEEGRVWEVTAAGSARGLLCSQQPAVTPR